MTGTVPIVPWDPTNVSGLVAWSCTCLSDAIVTAAGGSWLQTPPHSYDATYGMQLDSYQAAGGSMLQFDLNGQIATTVNVPNFQLSMDVETSQLIAYVAGSTYFNGVNASPGNMPFVVGDNIWQLLTREATLGSISGCQFYIQPTTNANQRWGSGISSFGKNFMTRIILVRYMNAWQLWTELQDANYNRTGLALLTEYGEDLAAAQGGYGNLQVSLSTAAVQSMRYIQFFSNGAGATRTVTGCHVRNVQLVTQAPSQTAHPLLRSIASFPDSYASSLHTHGGAPTPAKNSTASLNTAITADLQSDSNCMVRALAKIKHRTGALLHGSVACDVGGTTLINGYGASRSSRGLTGGTFLVSKPMTYMTTDYLVPCGSGAANTTPVARANTTAYALGDVITPATANGFVYACAVAGTSAGSPPTFSTSFDPTASADLTTDGSVTWRTLHYDQLTSDSSFVRRGYYRPSLLLHFGGFNDADYLQRNTNGVTSYTVYAGYTYANYGDMFTDLHRKWLRAVLDLYPSLRVLLITIPVAPNANSVNGVSGVTRVPAINSINATYLAEPAYFQALSPTNAAAPYTGRVFAVDFASYTGRTTLAGANTVDFPDGTHPTGPFMIEAMTETVAQATQFMMGNPAANSVIALN